MQRNPSFLQQLKNPIYRTQKISFLRARERNLRPRRKLCSTLGKRKNLVLAEFLLELLCQMVRFRRMLLPPTNHNFRTKKDSMPGKPIWLYSTFVAQKRNPRQRQSHRSPHDSKATGTNATMSCTNFLYIWIWKEGKSLKEIAWTVQVNRQQERRLGSTLRKKAHT